MAIPLGGMAIFFLWQWLNGGITPKEAVEETRRAVDRRHVPKKEPRREEPAPKAKEEEPKSSEAAAIPSRRAARHERGGEIVLIIDDLGFEGQPLDRVMALDPNVNCAILPNGTRTAEFAEELHERGFEILCHLPMQPRGKAAPGRNAILTSMSDEEIARVTRENIEAVRYARGVNNHMGSLATADRRVMTSVLEAMPEGMYFIDSRTAGSSIGAEVARELNVRTATRNVFLDDVATESAVRRQLNELATLASKHGLAIGIGHPHPATMRVLTEELPELKAQGFRLVRASEVVR